jgi:hypothetical protein
MIKENIFVAINHNDEIQWVKGSSSKTRYFRTDKYLKRAVEYHNKYHPEDIWKVRKCVIVEDNLQERDNESCDEIWERAYKEREGKKHREEAIKALKEIRDMMMNSDDWESMRRLIDAVTMGAFAIARLNEIDYGKTESEDKND